MSFTPRGRGVDRSFELVRMSLLQGDALPFQDALTVEQMRLAFEAEGVSFGEDDEPTNIRPTNIRPTNDEPAPDAGSQGVFTMGMTLWAMLSQALFTDVQRSCPAIVSRGGPAGGGVLGGVGARGFFDQHRRVLSGAGQGDGGCRPPSDRRGRGAV